MESPQPEHTDLKHAYEQIVEVYVRASEQMLKAAADPSVDAAAFFEASRTTSEVWRKLSAMRALLRADGILPSAEAEQRLLTIRHPDADPITVRL